MLRPKIAPPRGVLTAGFDDGHWIKHARYHPSADLAGYIEHFWAAHWDRRGLLPQQVETLPHPSVHMLFESGIAGAVAGVARGKFSRLLAGEGGILAIKFRPGGFYPFVRRPIAGFADSVVTLGSVWGEPGDELERAILAANDDDASMTILEGFLRDRQPIYDRHAALAGAIVEAIATNRRIRTVDDVGREFGLPARNLQRLFARYIGVNPKWVIQRYRLHEAAEQLGRGSGTQGPLAAELGYADQAHFIKDFKATVGTSPAAYAKRARGTAQAPGPLTRSAPEPGSPDTSGRPVARRTRRRVGPSSTSGP